MTEPTKAPPAPTAGAAAPLDDATRLLVRAAAVLAVGDDSAVRAAVVELAASGADPSALGPAADQGSSTYHISSVGYQVRSGQAGSNNLSKYKYGGFPVGLASGYFFEPLFPGLSP